MNKGSATISLTSIFAGFTSGADLLVGKRLPGGHSGHGGDDDVDGDSDGDDDQSYVPPISSQFWSHSIIADAIIHHCQLQLCVGNIQLTWYLSRDAITISTFEKGVYILLENPQKQMCIQNTRWK